jgi:hypothetical protein
MYELYAHFLAEWLETDHMEGVSTLGVSETEQENKEEEASEALLDLYSRAESAGVASDVLAQGHVNLLIRLGKEEEARELARKNCMEGASLCGSANAWALYMLLERSFLTVDSDGMIQMAKLFRQALKIPIADAKPLWQMVSYDCKVSTVLWYLSVRLAYVGQLPVYLSCGNVEGWGLKIRLSWDHLETNMLKMMSGICRHLRF